MRRLVTELDDELHHEFKAECASNRESLKDAIIDLIKYYIQTSKNPAKLKK